MGRMRRVVPQGELLDGKCLLSGVIVGSLDPVVVSTTVVTLGQSDPTVVPIQGSLPPGWTYVVVGNWDTGVAENFLVDPNGAVVAPAPSGALDLDNLPPGWTSVVEVSWETGETHWYAVAPDGTFIPVAPRLPPILDYDGDLGFPPSPSPTPPPTGPAGPG